MTTETLAGHLRQNAVLQRLKELLETSLWPWCLLAALAYAAIETQFDIGALRQSFGDPDDATRLTTVREFIAGAPWFDTTLPRFGAPEPLVSHWSRLIDLPLAVLMSLAGWAMSPENAELAVRYVWPMIWLVPLLFILARAAEAKGGRAAAMIALALAILSFAAVAQFRPGRIDHHNLQNLACVAGVVMLAASFSVPRLGAFAGLSFGLGLAIGYEALLVTGSAFTMAVLLAAVTGRGGDAVARAVVAFAVTLVAAFVLTTAPSQMLDIHCDAISLNMVGAVVIGAVGVWATMSHGRDWPLWGRLGALAGAGALAISAFALAEPACLAGPFGQVDPRVKPIWLDHVMETRSILWVLANIPPLGIASLVHLAAGLAGMAIVLRSDREDGPIFYGLVFAVTAVLCCLQVKLLPYAALLAVPPLAIAISRIKGTGQLSAPVLQFGAATLINQKALIVFAAMLAGAGDGASERFQKDSTERAKCFATDNLKPLAGLAPGLAVAEASMGPYLVAATRLNVLSAPYHRLDYGIIAAHQILTSDVDDAEGLLRGVGADYVVACASYPMQEPSLNTGGANALRHMVLSGQAPSYLEPLPVDGDTPLKVWRVKPRT